MNRDVSRFTIGKSAVCAAAVFALAALAPCPLSSLRAASLTEINPTHSDNADADAATGGRINHIAADPNNSKIFFAASEWGGLFRTDDRGKTWKRIDGHLPVVTMDIKVNPGNSNRVYATSLYDGRAASLSGIQTSEDGGITWSKPKTAAPPPGFCATNVRKQEPAAFGIAVDASHPDNVWVGTNCGLAVSRDAGSTWTYLNPLITSQQGGAVSITSVVVHHNGVIDLCGETGHRRSLNGGATWTGPSSSGAPLPSGTCSIAASPHEQYVLFAVVGTTFFESDDGGLTWAPSVKNPSPQGRVPFVKTNARDSHAFDLWIADVSLYRVSCTTPEPPSSGGVARCSPSSDVGSGFTRDVGGHDDMGDLVFDTSATNACPVMMSSDGGVYLNNNLIAPACNTPSWIQPTVTPSALWLWGVAANVDNGHADRLLMVAQDTGVFSSSSGAIWSALTCCDSFDAIATDTFTLYTECCFEPGGEELFRGDASGNNPVQVTTPPGDLVSFRSTGAINRFGVGSVVALTTNGVYWTNNISAQHVTWTALGKNPPGNPCGVEIAGTSAKPMFLVQSGSCNGSDPDQVWVYTGTSPSGTWNKLQPPIASNGGQNGFGIITVDPNDGKQIIASHVTTSGVSMILSNNGGASWANLPDLDSLMTGNGAFRMLNQSGLNVRGNAETQFIGYVQPTLIAISPFDKNIIVAGGADSGIFASFDGTKHWTVLTDNSGLPGKPVIPRPIAARFSQQSASNSLFIASRGRGLWKIVYGSNNGATP
jgi:photosystem II stability/assembly factor-like uncharacterized protein